MKKILFLCGFLIFFSQNISAQTAGLVNGVKISVKEANSALSQLYKGQNKTWANISDEDKIRLIQMMAPSKLVSKVSVKELKKDEKENALAAYWMQKELSKIKISDKEAKKGYNKLKKMMKKMNSKQKLPSFKEAKESVKMQLAQEKILKSLLKKAKIRLK